jgi:hypothetical protein
MRSSLQKEASLALLLFSALGGGLALALAAVVAGGGAGLALIVFVGTSAFGLAGDGRAEAVLERFRRAARTSRVGDRDEIDKLDVRDDQQPYGSRTAPPPRPAQPVAAHRRRADAERSDGNRRGRRRRPDFRREMRLAGIEPATSRSGGARSIP